MDFKRTFQSFLEFLTRTLGPRPDQLVPIFGSSSVATRGSLTFNRFFYLTMTYVLCLNICREHFISPEVPRSIMTEKFGIFIKYDTVIHQARQCVTTTELSYFLLVNNPSEGPGTVCRRFLRIVSPALNHAQLVLILYFARSSATFCKIMVM